MNSRHFALLCLLAALTTSMHVDEQDGALHVHNHDDDDHDHTHEGIEDKGKPLIGHTCIHDAVQMKDVPTIEQSYSAPPFWATKKSSHRTMDVMSTYAKTRFRFFFDVEGTGHCGQVGDFVTTYQDNKKANCTEKDILTPLKKDYIINVLMPNAINFLSQALYVNPVNGTIKVGAQCGSFPGVTTPTSHQTTGVANADYVIYVTAVPLASSSNSMTVAWASSCANDQYGRPYVGQINFVPSALSNAEVRKQYLTEQDTLTAIHEACHALGYSSTYFDTYVDGGVKHGTGGKTTTTDATLGKSVTKLVSPKILAAGKAYFGCSSLDGVEIEDQGGAGTTGTHWEKRILYTEFLCGILSSVKTYISSLTLAYFEDKGFYLADYSLAQDKYMAFGNNKGCNFVTKRCNDATVKASGSEFCFDQDSTHSYCSTDFLARGYCGVGEFGTSLANNFQYFAGSTIGGVVELSDYCPTGLPYSNLVCIDSTATDTQNVYGNTYGPQSRCFQSNLGKSGYGGADAAYETRCFPVSCTTTGSIQLDVQGYIALCPLDGSAGQADVSAVSGFTGSIICPKATVFCPKATTSSPTPAPAATPAPVPPPPGQTSAPAPTSRPISSALATALPASCADRVACADALVYRLPACRRLADQLISCFGTTCDGQLASWLSTNKLSCDDPFTWGKANCIEGPSGGAAMCNLLGIS